MNISNTAPIISLLLFINWQSIENVQKWTDWFDYSGALDFVVAILGLLAISGRLKGKWKKFIEWATVALAIVAGLCWIVDSKLNHRLTDLQAQNQQDRTITASQIEKFKSALINAKTGPVWVINAASSRETSILASIIRNMLNATGYSVPEDQGPTFAFGPGVGGHGLATPMNALAIMPSEGGIGLVAISAADSQNPPPQAVALSTAFDKAGIKMRGVAWPTNLVKGGEVFVIIQAK